MTRFVCGGRLAPGAPVAEGSLRGISFRWWRCRAMKPLAQFARRASSSLGGVNCRQYILDCGESGLEAGKRGPGLIIEVRDAEVVDAPADTHRHNCGRYAVFEATQLLKAQPSGIGLIEALRGRILVQDDACCILSQLIDCGPRTAMPAGHTRTALSSIVAGNSTSVNSVFLRAVMLRLRKPGEVRC